MTNTIKKEKGFISTTPKFVKAVSVYKKEVWYDYNKEYSKINPKQENFYHLVSRDNPYNKIFDYNIGNNKNYKYLLRLIYDDAESGDLQYALKEIVLPIDTKWNGWSIVELHKSLDIEDTYTASIEDVWRFNYNVSTGAETQNFQKIQQDTLGRYSKFSGGVKNTISGNVECLMGRDVIQAIYTTNKYKYSEITSKYNQNTKYVKDQCVYDEYEDEDEGKYYKKYYRCIKNTDSVESPTDPTDPTNPEYWEETERLAWQLQPETTYKNLGGYQESLHKDGHYANLTSNESIDMLKKFREMCYSGNPKLLKDNKGKRYVIQIKDSSNTTQNSIYNNPEIISFSWEEVENADSISVIENYYDLSFIDE